jgi:protein transport protein DSL1/ZW10
VEVREVVEEMKGKSEELKVKRELLGLVGVIVGLNERLESVKKELKSGKLKVAAEGLKELKVALRIGEEDDREPLVYGLLRNEWSQCFEEVLFFLFLIHEALPGTTL